MNCAYHADKEAVTRCVQCRRPLCGTCAIPQKGGTFICSRCAALQAADDASRGIDRRQAEKDTRQQKSMEKKEKKKKRMVALKWAVLAVCLAVMAMQAPRFLSMFEGEKPIRNGTYATNGNADKCIQNLWSMSRRLQEGKSPGKDLVCPETGRAYIVTTGEDDTVVTCPNPEVHALTKMSVSRKHPVPRIVK